MSSTDKVEFAIDPQKFRHIKNISLFLIDLFWLFLSVTVIYSFYFSKGIPPIVSYGSLALFYIFVTNTMYFIFDVNEPKSELSGLHVSGRVLVIGFINILIIAGVLYFVPKEIVEQIQLGRVTLVGTFISSAVLSAFTRILFAKIYGGYTKSLNVGLCQFDKNSKNLNEQFKEVNANFFLLNESEVNLQFLKNKRIQILVLCPHETYDKQFLSNLIDFRLAGGGIYTTYEFSEEFLKKIPLESIKGEFFAFANGFPLVKSKVRNRIKRFVDLAVSVIGITLSSPLMLIVGFLVKVTSKGPIIYSQIRTGIQGKPFRVYKFRTMVQNAEKNGAQWAQKNDSRITPLGNFLRKTRLDELPQFVNILKGEMSIVGPRPERPEMNEMLAKEIPFYNLRHSVKPGVTGWAQVMYQYGASVEDSIRKFEYELYYIKNFNLFMDISVILKTIKVVLGLKGR